ncbi:plasmid stabilization protein [Chishuiella sp.]|uniref:type II toxin-antitoxin system RelE family toxin n=1 Tax=Chishuiella sp. TaxID=1969467 RepID=UPI0028B1C18B|nr:plasmid stabilization protein [Chishuiella sp.]
MEVIFLKSFLNDIKKINDKKLKYKIKEFILQVEKSNCIDDIANIKKLKGYSTAYRYRVGDYRLGFYLNENVIELAKFVKRNDIYKVFP